MHRYSRLLSVGLLLACCAGAQAQGRADHPRVSTSPRALRAGAHGRATCFPKTALALVKTAKKIRILRILTAESAARRLMHRKERHVDAVHPGPFPDIREHHQALHQHRCVKILVSQTWLRSEINLGGLKRFIECFFIES